MSNNLLTTPSSNVLFFQLLDFLGRKLMSTNTDSLFPSIPMSLSVYIFLITLARTLNAVLKTSGDTVLCTYCISWESL